MSRVEEIFDRIFKNVAIFKEMLGIKDHFYARCKIQGKVCLMSIDGGITTNLASPYMVERLGLKIIKHPTPYKFPCPISKSEVMVTNQVLVPFSIGGYQDEVLCDVVPMQTSHLLLGSFWKDDRKAFHDGVTNKIHVTQRNKKYILVPLPSHEVLEDQRIVQKQLAEHDISNKAKGLASTIPREEQQDQAKSYQEFASLEVHPNLAESSTKKDVEEEKYDKKCKEQQPTQLEEKQTTIDKIRSEKLVVEWQRDQHKVKHYDFVFGEVQWMKPPRVVKFNFKFQQNFQMDMVSFLQIRGGWLEKYLIYDTSLVEKGTKPTLMESHFHSHIFVPCLPRVQKDFSWQLRAHTKVINNSSHKLLSMSSIVICFNSQSFDSCGYTCLFWLMGMMLTRKMLVDETTRDRIAYAYLNKMSFVYFYVMSLCFISYYDANSNPMLASGLFCFLGLPCLLNVDHDLRSNPCEEGGNDEDITKQPQETQAKEALMLKPNYKFAHFRGFQTSCGKIKL